MPQQTESEFHELIARLGFELQRMDNGEVAFADMLPIALQRAGLIISPASPMIAGQVAGKLFG